MRGAFDFETWDWVNPLCCGFKWGSSTAPNEHYIADPKVNVPEFKRWTPEKVAEDALLFLHESKVPDWWAHNMGKFDGLLLSAAAKRLGWQQSACLAGGRVISFTFRPPGAKRSVKVFDSFAVLPSSLRSVAKDWELPSGKLFTADDYSIDARLWEPAKLKAGCLIDCQLVLEALEKAETLLEDWGGKLKMTFSASALSVVKADLAERGQEIPSHKKMDLTGLNALAREGYYGARVEVLHHKPEHDLTEWDICSSYPWAMTQPLPWHPYGKANKAGCERMMQGSFEGMLEARVRVPPMQYPPLPYRAPKGGVYFPTGEWRAWFPACELRYAQSLGCDVQVTDGILYEPAQPFEAFIRKVYALKAKSTGAVRTFAKLTLNGCYGKFGQKPERSDLRIFGSEIEAREFIFNHPGKCEPIGSDITSLAVEKMMWSNHAHFAVASYITALARMKLHAAMVRSEGLAYVDSDSIHAGALFPTHTHIDAPEPALAVRFGLDLGDWKVEIPQYRGEFFAPKIYRLTEPSGKEHFAAKGFPVNKEAFEKLVTQQPVEVERMRLLKSQLRAGGADVTRQQDSKAWHGRSTKRKPLPDGGTVPWTVRELLGGAHRDALSPLARRLGAAAAELDRATDKYEGEIK